MILFPHVFIVPCDIHVFPFKTMQKENFKMRGWAIWQSVLKLYFQQHFITMKEIILIYPGWENRRWIRLLWNLGIYGDHGAQVMSYKVIYVHLGTGGGFSAGAIL